MCSSSYFKTISQILIFAVLHLCWLTSYGYAEMLPTESAVQTQTDRQRILDLMDRREVVDELEKYGISKMEAVARINSFTDGEVTVIAGKLDALPAGGRSTCITKKPGGGGYNVGPCESSSGGGAVLAVIGILVLVVLLIYWIFSRNKAEVDSPSSKEGPSSETVVEEVCDPADVTALIMGSCD